MASVRVLILAIAFFVTEDVRANPLAADGDCPPLWTKYQDHCYRFFGGPMAWEAAELHCRESITCHSGAIAHLVSIHNQDENTFVYDLWQTSLVAGFDEADYEQYANRANAVWIGMEDREIEGTLAWSDETALDYTTWKSGEPNNSDWDSTGNGEDCVHMWKSTSRNINDKWNDIPCTHLMPFVCKMPTD